jgi:hypothetical protein
MMRFWWEIHLMFSTESHRNLAEIKVRFEKGRKMREENRENTLSKKPDMFFKTILALQSIFIW